MTQSSLRYFIPIVVLACSGAEKKTAAEPTPVASERPKSGGDERNAFDLCGEMFARQKECTDTFIPALVDARIAADAPAGIAARAQSEGRDAIIAEAMEEWATDATPDAVAATCEMIVADTPPERLEAMDPAARRCLDSDDCTAFVECAVALAGQHLK